MPHASTPETKYAASQGIDYAIPPPPDFGISESLAQFDELGHVHFKVTDINFDRLEGRHFASADFVRALADRFGTTRLLWGSDVGQSPAPYTEKVERLHAAAVKLSAAERAQFFGGTAPASVRQGIRVSPAPADDAPLIDCHAHVWGPGMPFAANAWEAAGLHAHRRAIHHRTRCAWHPLRA